MEDDKNKNKINDIEKKDNKGNKDNKDNKSKILILYDEYQFSSESANEKIKNIFKAIESHNEDKNNKKKLFHNDKQSIININNKYYTCDISYEIMPINKIENIELALYEGIIIFLEETSIKNKIFAEKSHHFKEEHNFSSCIIIFEEDRDDLQNVELFDQFIGETIDKHFEVICNCENLKEYNEDDGIGAVNLSLHSTQWKGSKSNVEKKEEKKETNEKKEKKDDGKIYKELIDSDEIEKVFGRIKEIKQMNSNPNISNEERRNNAEKAVMMLMEMLGVDEDDNEEGELSDEEKKKEKEKEDDKK
jgi:hypothetical protein